MRHFGVDGCKAGWLAVIRSGAGLEYRFLAHVDDLADEFAYRDALPEDVGRRLTGERLDPTTAAALVRWTGDAVRVDPWDTVQLYFDADLEAKVFRLRAALTKAGVSPTLERLGDRPHASLAVLNEVNVERCNSEIGRLAQSQSWLPVSLSAFGAFPTSAGVVSLAPTPTEHLLAVHRTIHKRLSAIGPEVHRHYLRESWVPHATIGFELPSREVEIALSWLQANFVPVSGSFLSVGLIEVLPAVKQLSHFSLLA